MVSLSTWLVAAALMVPGDIQIVKFTADWCGPCRELEPTLQRFAKQGYELTHVNVDQRADLARQYQISSVPTLLLVANGQVVDRVVGNVGEAELATRLQRLQESSPNSRRAAPRGPQTTVASVSPGASGSTAEDLARQATVRLRVEDPAGHSFGSGTIVHVHQQQDAHAQDALILTCGHLFRESQGKGKIVVDLVGYANGAPTVGQLIRYDLERDLALVGIRTDLPVRPVPVAGTEYHVATGQQLFSLGCNHGKAPSILRGQLKAVNKYLGPENLVVSGRPVDGRSGGGLFSYDGRLVGVCNAADQEVDEGLYAAFASIHRHLDDARLTFVYRDSHERQPKTQVAVADGPQGSARGASPRERLADLIPESRLDTRGLAAAANGPEPNSAEVICIIRSKNQPDQPSEVLVLDRPSRDFIRTLTREHELHKNRQMTRDRRANDSEYSPAPVSRPRPAIWRQTFN